jgi:hypothetical protein
VTEPSKTPEQVERYRNSRGELKVIQVRPAVLHLEVSGHLDRSLGNLIVQRAAELAAQGSFTIFLDCSAMRGFDAEVRGTLRRFKSQFGDCLTVHMLMGSKLHSMLVAVARLSLGSTLIGYTSGEDFAAVLRQVRLGPAERPRGPRGR